MEIFRITTLFFELLIILFGHLSTATNNDDFEAVLKNNLGRAGVPPRVYRRVLEKTGARPIKDMTALISILDTNIPSMNLLKVYTETSEWWLERNRQRSSQVHFDDQGGQSIRSSPSHQSVVPQPQDRPESSRRGNRVVLRDHEEQLVRELWHNRHNPLRVAELTLGDRTGQIARRLSDLHINTSRSTDANTYPSGTASARTSNSRVRTASYYPPPGFEPRPAPPTNSDNFLNLTNEEVNVLRNSRHLLSDPNYSNWPNAARFNVNPDLTMGDLRTYDTFMRNRNNADRNRGNH